MCSAFLDSLRIESPYISIRWAFMHKTVQNAVGQRWNTILVRPSARLAGEVKIAERTWQRSSQISQKSRRSSSVSGAITQLRHEAFFRHQLAPKKVPVCANLGLLLCQ